MCLQEDDAPDHEELKAAAAQEDSHFDRLPGGTAVAWPQGQRPAWFTALLAECQAGGCDTVGTKSSKLKLTEKQRKKCLRVVCKMLKRRQSGVKLREVVDKVLEVLSVEEGAKKSSIRSRVKTVIKKGDGWSIANGMLTPAVAVVA